MCFFSKAWVCAASVTLRGVARTSLAFITPPWCRWSSAAAACGGWVGGMPPTRRACLAPTHFFPVREHAGAYAHTHSCLGNCSSISLWHAHNWFNFFSFLMHKKSVAAKCSDFIWQHHTLLSFLSHSSADSQSSPLVRGGLLGSVRVPQSSATCMSWGGAHYRTFDRKHFHFQGSCTYLMASSTDGTWAVYISTVCDGRGDCSKVGNVDGVHWMRSLVVYSCMFLDSQTTTSHNVAVVNGDGDIIIAFRLLEKQWCKWLLIACSACEYMHVNVYVAVCFQALRMMLGLDLVSIHQRNLTLNNLPVPNEEPLFQNGKIIFSCLKSSLLVPCPVWYG